MKHLIKIGILAAATLLLFSIRSENLKDSNFVYSVGIRSLPSKIDPWLSQVNSEHLINLNLYYPLISNEKKDGTISSKFLDLDNSHSLTRDFKTFSLCLLKDVLYSDGTQIEPTDLLYDIEQFHRNQEIAPALDTATIAGRCVIVKLKRSAPNYFGNLTSTASTLLKRSSLKTKLPIGLGPYLVSDFNDETIKLLNPNSKPSEIKSLVFIKVTDFNDALKKGVTDFNFIFSSDKIPDDFYHLYRKVNVTALKTYALLLSVNEGSIRKSLAACIDGSAIASITGMDLTRSPGFLPRGILGAGIEKKKQALNICHFKKNKPKIVFYNYNPKITADLKRYFEKSSDLLPVNVIVEEHSLKETIENGFQKKEMLAIVGFDGSGSQAGEEGEAAVYFESFFRNERIISKPIDGLKQSVLSALQADSADSKVRFYERAHHILLESGYVVPLGQLQLEQYYPSSISNIIWGDQVGGYPEYAFMRVKG